MKDIKKSKLINVLIPFGIAFLLVTIVFTFLNTSKKSIDVLSLVFLSVQFILGILITILSLKITHRAAQLFIGTLLLTWGLLHFFVQYIFDADFVTFWPVYGILTGILLFIAGLYRYSKLKFGYAIPSLTIFGMGIWYSLFSFEIIKISFVKIVESLGFVFVLLVAILLVAFFFAQQKNKKLVVEDEDTGTFSDDDDEIINIDE